MRTKIVTVTYDSLSVLPQMLASVPQGVPVSIVENGQGNGEALRKLISARDGARLIVNAQNLGFGAACNLGAEGAGAEFLLFLNPDTALGAGAIDALERAMDSYPEAAAMNPLLLDARGGQTHRRSCALLAERMAIPRRGIEVDTETRILSGAALFVRRSAFDAVGGFDPKIFMYHEDDDLCLRLSALPARLMIIPAASVRHLAGRSSARSPQIAAIKGRAQGESLVYVLRKHRRPFPLMTAYRKAILQFLSPDFLFSARKRAKVFGFLNGVRTAATYRVEEI